MNGEGKNNTHKKGILDRRSSKVSPDDLRVKRDGPANWLVAQGINSLDNEGIFSKPEERSDKSQRKKFEAARDMVKKEWLPEFKIEFLEKIELLRQSGDLSLSVEEIKKRLSGIQIFFFDSDSLASSLRDDARGVVSQFSSVHLGINTNFSGDEKEMKADLQHTFNHEMLHVVSGKLFLTTPRHLGVFNTEKYRTGLFFGPRENDGNVERFEWLNEAVTETLALDMDKGKNIKFPSYYSEERLLLSLLMNGPVGKSGFKIDKKKFTNAYFEDYEANDAVEIRLQYWKELMHAVNDLYYPGFLVKIDKIIKRKGGVDYVIHNFQRLCQDKNSN